MGHPSRHCRASGQVAESGWSETLQEIAVRLSAYRGKPGAVAAVGSARATTEEQFLLAALVRDTFGSELVEVVARLQTLLCIKG